MPEDVYVTALSGGNLLGMARIQDVTIKAGKKSTYDAPLRKPLVFVGSMLPAEMGAANKTTPVQILDPLSSEDLARAPGTPANLTAMTAGASTWDGRFVVVAQGTTLTAFDTGSGKMVAGTLALSFSPSRLGGRAARSGDRRARSGQSDRRIAGHHQRRRRLRRLAGGRHAEGGAHAGRDRAHRGLFAGRQQAVRAHRRHDRRSVCPGARCRRRTRSEIMGSTAA